MRGGRLIAAVHQRYLRTWPREIGGGCAIETTDPELELEARVTALLAGHEGVFHVQFAQGYVIDVNPRIFGSMTLAAKAGANLAAIACEALAGREPGLTVRGRPGVFYRWLDGDVRRTALALRTGEIRIREALRWLGPRWGAAHGVESLTDPMPMLARLAGRVHPW